MLSTGYFVSDLKKIEYSGSVVMLEPDMNSACSPDGNKIAWVSSAGFDIDLKSIEGHEWMKYPGTELMKHW